MNFAIGFRPKLLDTLKDYTRADLHADIAVGSVAPQAGIFTAVIAGILISRNIKPACYSSNFSGHTAGSITSSPKY